MTDLYETLSLFSKVNIIISIVIYLYREDGIKHKNNTYRSSQAPRDLSRL